MIIELQNTSKLDNTKKITTAQLRTNRNSQRKHTLSSRQLHPTKQRRSNADRVCCCFYYHHFVSSKAAREAKIALKTTTDYNTITGWGDASHYDRASPPDDDHSSDNDDWIPIVVVVDDLDAMAAKMTTAKHHYIYYFVFPRTDSSLDILYTTN